MQQRHWAQALQQVDTMGVDIQSMLARGLRPKKLFVAHTRDNAQAKDYGFTWDESIKGWRRWMPPEDVESLPFPVTEIAP